jgi:hypothetical protein
MSIKKFLYRLKYGFYTIESIKYIANQRLGVITTGLVGGLICNILSIIGLKYMISLGVVPLCSIVLAAFFLFLYIMYIIEKKYFDDELFERYIKVFKRESFIRKALWSVSAYALMVVFFAYFFVSIAFFFMS